MDMTHVNVEVANPTDMRRSRTVRLVVDSGLRYTVVPTEILAELGIQSFAEERFKLPNGEHVVRRKGAALFKYEDRIGGSDVVFGQPGDAALLGSLTLGSLGLELDPLRREFRDVPMMLA